jgi:DNA-binding MarR family transcriptional regulator
LTQHIDEEDRRKRVFELNDISYEVLKKHEQFHDVMLHDIFTDLNLEQDVVLLKSLQRISDYFKSKY